MIYIIIYYAYECQLWKGLLGKEGSNAQKLSKTSENEALPLLFMDFFGGNVALFIGV